MQKRVEAQARAATEALRITSYGSSRPGGGGRRAGGTLRDVRCPDIYSSGADVIDITKNYEAAKRKVARLEAQWAEAVESLEQAT